MRNSAGTNTCPLCGYRFDASGMICHPSCPMSGNCAFVCCPNCGYQFPDEARMGITGALKRAWENRWVKSKEAQP